jgi:hypothetical protein
VVVVDAPGIAIPAMPAVDECDDWWEEPGEAEADAVATG